MRPGINAASAFSDVEAFTAGGVRPRPYELDEIDEVAPRGRWSDHC
jgi:hypothetical protein